MSERRQRQTGRNKLGAYIAAGLVHLGIIAALVYNFTNSPESIEADFAEKVDVVKATTVEESQIEQRLNELKQKDRNEREHKKKEQERLKKLQQEAEREEQRIENLKEKQKQERELADDLERERKQIALKKAARRRKAKEGRISAKRT